MSTCLREILVADAGIGCGSAPGAQRAAADEVARLEAQLYAEHLFYVTRFLVTLKNKKKPPGKTSRVLHVHGVHDAPTEQVRALPSRTGHARPAATGVRRRAPGPGAQQLRR